MFNLVSVSDQLIFFFQNAIDDHEAKKLQAESEWELQCVLDETSVSPVSVFNGNGHAPMGELNGDAAHEVAVTNGYHTCQLSQNSYKELLTRPHIQQRLDSYRQSKQARIVKFLAHLSEKQSHYFENICSN